MFLPLAFLFAACAIIEVAPADVDAAAARYGKVHKGMMRDDVVRLVGKPQSVDDAGGSHWRTYVPVVADDDHNVNMAELDVLFASTGRAVDVKQRRTRISASFGYDPTASNRNEMLLRRWPEWKSDGTFVRDVDR